MDMQNVSNLQIPEGIVRTIHDKDNRLLWGKVAYNTKYAGNTIRNGAPTPDDPVVVQTVTGRQVVAVTGGDSESAEYEINLGKNLIYNHATDKSQGGVDMTMNADGTVTANGNGTGDLPIIIDRTNL